VPAILVNCMCVCNLFSCMSACIPAGRAMHFVHTHTIILQVMAADPIELGSLKACCL